MKVGLVTTWDERCGVAEYSRNLVENMSKDVQFDIQHRRFWNESALTNNDCQIIHLNYEPGLFDSWFTIDLASRLCRAGKKLVLTLNTTHEGRNWSSFTSVFDKVIVHEQTQDSFTHIPHGIEIVEPVSSDGTWTVGWMGFPFSWKGMDLVAQATATMGLNCLIIMPESRHVEVSAMATYIRSVNPRAEVITEYLPVRKIQEYYFSRCSMTAFPYEGGNYGISGAVRVGLGVKRPTIITRNRQFRDLYAYEDELHIMSERSVNGLIDQINAALSRPRYPQKILEDMSWKKSAAMYKQVYEEVLGV